MQKKSILIIGGGEIGLNQIRIAKKIGFNVIVTDINPDAPGLKEADVSVNISGTDIKSLVIFALENKEKYNISAVYCGNDFGLLSAECIKQVLGLPHNSIEAVIRCINKKLMKDCWIRDNIPTPEGYLIKNSLSEAKIAIERAGLPAIVKTVDSSGSQGISLVKNKEDLQRAIQEAFKHSNFKFILIEKFINGTHHDVNGFFYNKKFYKCGVFDRYFTPFPYCVPIYGFYPSNLSIEIINKIYKITESAAKSIGIENGPVKGDIVLFDDDIYIYEISNRFHGDVSTSHLYTFCQTVTPIELYIKLLYQQKERRNIEIQTPNNICGWYVLNLKLGKIKEIKGLGKVRDIKGVRKILFNKKIGDTISVLKDNTNVPGFVWISGKTRKDIDEKYNKVMEAIMIEYE
jgi:biotin carboxylase